MSSGAKTQLVMVGEQDRFLSNAPTLNIFKTQWEHYEPFATQTTELCFNTVEFGNTSTCNLLMDPHLILDIKLRIQLPTLNIMKQVKLKCTKDRDMECFCDKCKVKEADTVFGWTNSIGHVMIKEYSFNVGSKQIYKSTGDWLEWDTEYCQPLEKKSAYWEMMGKREPSTFKPNTFSDSLDLIFPLKLYFTGNPGQAFPLCAIREDNVNIQIKWRPFDDCWICNKDSRPGFIPSFKASLLVDYAYVSPRLYNELTCNNHLYLIEQVQKSGPIQYNRNVNMPTFEMDFTQPVKAIYWAVKRQDSNRRSRADDPDFTYGNDWYNYSCFKSRNKNIVIDPIESAQILLNGEERDMEFPGKYYRLNKPYECHTKPPSNYMYMYNFSIRPEELQPLGTCNFSVYNNKKIRIRMVSNYPSDYEIYSYATSYNFLIVKGGKVTVAFPT